MGLLTYKRNISSIKKDEELKAGSINSQQKKDSVDKGLSACAQLEFHLEQLQRGQLEKKGRKMEGESRSTQENLGEIEKMRSGLEDLIKR